MWYHLTKNCNTRSKRHGQYLSGYSEKNDKENPLHQNNVITSGKLRNNIQKATDRRRLLFLKNIKCQEKNIRSYRKPAKELLMVLSTFYGEVEL